MTSLSNLCTLQTTLSFIDIFLSKSDTNCDQNSNFIGCDPLTQLVQPFHLHQNIKIPSKCSVLAPLHLLARISNLQNFSDFSRTFKNPKNFYNLQELLNFQSFSDKCLFLCATLWHCRTCYPVQLGQAWTSARHAPMLECPNKRKMSKKSGTSLYQWPSVHIGCWK